MVNSKEMVLLFVLIPPEMVGNHNIYTLLLRIERVDVDTRWFFYRHRDLATSTCPAS